jgi:lipid-A-disaccharide synthase-like uncharacterized protein
VNLIAENSISGFQHASTRVSRFSAVIHAAVAAFGLYLLELVTAHEIGGLWGSSAAAAVSYVLVIYLYFGFIRVVYRGSALAVWLIGVAGAILTALTASATPWPMVMKWLLLTVAGHAVGRFYRAGMANGRVYIIGALVVTAVAIAQWAPAWSQVVEALNAAKAGFVEDARASMVAAGFTPERVSSTLADFDRGMRLVIRLAPAGILMSSLMQFSVGFLIFARWLGAREAHRKMFPVSLWKMPFGLTPVLMAAILARFVFADDVRMLADNVLAVLSVYYCLGGLALIEHALAKLRLTRGVKVAFYILLFLTQVIGFVITAMLGFIDSFADWRKVRLKRLAY